MANTDINWYAMSDKTIPQIIGQFLIKARLQWKKAQQEPAVTAGITRIHPTANQKWPSQYTGILYRN
jgi:hypothetical protein